MHTWNTSRLPWATAATVVPSKSQQRTCQWHGKQQFWKASHRAASRGPPCCPACSNSFSLSSWLTHYFHFWSSGSRSLRKPRKTTWTSTPHSSNRNPTLKQIRTWKLAEDSMWRLESVLFPTTDPVKWPWAVSIILCTRICQGFTLYSCMVCSAIISNQFASHIWKKKRQAVPCFQPPQGIEIVWVQERKLTTPFRKLRVPNMFLKLLLSIFNVQESQFRLDRKQKKQA